MFIIEWDNDGYPTEKSLCRLAEVLRNENVKEAIDAFYNALEENFYYECCGLTKIEVRGEEINVWEYHTMGWSGNEDIINILKQCWLWSIFFERHDKGGHYYFKPKEEDVNK